MTFKAALLMRNQDVRNPYSMFVNLTLCIMGSGRLGGHKPYHRAVINYPLYGQCDLSDENMFNREQIKIEGQKSRNGNELEHADKEKFFFQRRYQALTEMTDTLSHNSAIPAT